MNKNKLQLRMKEVPERKSDVPLCLRPYFHLRDDLVVQGDLIFKGRRLVVSSSIRKELMSATHISIEGYSGGPENVFFGLECSLMSKAMFPNVTCLAHRTSLTKEPLLQYEVIARPCAKLTAD